MIFVLGQCDRNCLLSSRMYRARYPDRERHPRPEAFKKLLDRFLNTGSVNYQKEVRRKNVTNEENEFQVMTSLIDNPHTSLSELQQQLDISATSIRRIIKKNKFHPFHIQLHQELLERDFGARVDFCNWVQQKLREIPNFLDFILFSDEATFHKNGFVNRHNYHYYSDINPHLLHTSSQHKWSINVWGGIINTTIVGPFFFEGCLNGEMYETFLRNDFLALIQAIPQEVLNEMWYQHDGAPAHYAANVRNFLNEQFPNRWIGRGGEINWPARSPDMTPLDFFCGAT